MRGVGDVNRRLLDVSRLAEYAVAVYLPIEVATSYACQKDLPCPERVLAGMFDEGFLFLHYTLVPRTCGLSVVVAQVIDFVHLKTVLLECLDVLTKSIPIEPRPHISSVERRTKPIKEWRAPL